MFYSVTSRRAMAAVALVLLPFGAVAAVAATKPAATAQLCDIGTTSSSGMIRLDALVHPDRAVSGSYTFRVEKTGGGGSSTINQGGDFNAPAGETATLSTVSVGSQSAVYKAKLNVTIGGKSFSCIKQVGGS